MQKASGSLLRLIVGTFVVTALSNAAFAARLSTDGFGLLDVLLMGCSVVLVSWITFWCGLSLIGAVRILRTNHAGAPGDPRPDVHLSSRIALLLPIHNEPVERVFGNVRAMLESLSKTGQESAFDLFVLSDSTDPDLWLREELCWAALREELREEKGRPGVYYRRRARKFRWKSGNIADFCERWGSRYELMLVLDADSIMDGATIVELVRRIEKDPRIGILQAPSLPVGGKTLYARLQQFAASLYGPAIFAGLDACFGDAATYWGHNAIIRTRPFMDHCGLSGLPGRPPLGGPILSHDLVESALMRRAGYSVRLSWDLLSGSYEQCPSTLAESSRRDQRWCRGNLQHLRLLLSKDFAPTSRVHFAIGALFYGISLFWAAYVLVFPVASFMAGLELRPAPGGGAGAATVVLLGSVVLLLSLGKVAGLALVLRSRERKAAHGGTRALLFGVFSETVLSALIAPIAMTSHVACLFRALLGVTSGWAPSRAPNPSGGLGEATRAHFGHTVAGMALASFAFRCSPGAAAWLCPVWGPLVFSIPIAALLASPWVGTALRNVHVLTTPAEHHRPDVLCRAEELGAEPSAEATTTFAERFKRVISDAWLNTLHVELLKAAGFRARPPNRVQESIRRVTGTDFPEKDDALGVLGDPLAMEMLHAASHARPKTSP